MLRRIRLYGLAAKKFGKSFELDVASVAEATRALSLQVKGFREFVEKHHFHIVCGKTLKRGWVLGEDTVDFGLPEGDLHVLPVTEGAKRGGLFKIIAGVFLLAAAFFVPVIAPGLAATMGVTTVGGISFVGSIAAAGLGLIAAGITQMMTKTPKTEDPKDDSSFTIDGQLNVTEQGGAVPLIYGRFGVGSTLISAGVTTVEYPFNSGPDTSGTIGGSETGTTAATGSVSFTNIPQPLNTVTFNGLTFTFINRNARGDIPYGYVAIESTLSKTLDNLLSAVTTSVDSRVKLATYEKIGTTGVKVTYRTKGTKGNTYTLAENSPYGSVSGATLTGGA